MRVLAAMALLFTVSCTFDYGALKGTAPSDDGGTDSITRDMAADVPGRVPGDAPADAVVDSEADSAPVRDDASSPADVPADGPEIVVADAAPDGEPSTGGTGGTGATETGGTGGSTSVDTGGAMAGASGGNSATGGVVSSGGGGGATGLGGMSTSTWGTGGTGGLGGTGGTAASSSADAGVDSPVVDASVDASLTTDGDGDAGEATGDAFVCAPGEGQCIGNAYCSCNVAGSGCTNALQDCGSTMACNVPLGGCALVDTVPFNPSDPTGAGFSKNSTSNVMKLNFYSVSAARRLLQIEQHMAPAAGAPLHWVIYRAATKDGTYTLDKTYNSTATVSADGYQASPVIDYALESNSFYAIGVWWESSATAYWYHTSSANFPLALSSSGGISVTSGISPNISGATPVTAPASINWSASSSLYYPQRLSTR